MEQGEANGSGDLGRVALKKWRHRGVTSPASMAGGWMGMPKVEVVGAIYNPEEGEEEHLGEGMGFSEPWASSSGGASFPAAAAVMWRDGDGVVCAKGAR